MNKENHLDYLELPAPGSAFAETKAFYESAFGWKYQLWAEEYADTASSGVSTGINGDASHHTRAPLPVIYTADLENARRRCLEAGARLTRDIFSFPGGRRFHFTDPAGNELAVWSDQIASSPDQ